MAGRPSIDLARRQWREKGCEFVTVQDEIRFVTPGQLKNPEATRRLMSYWTHGPGAVKIGWGTKGSFRRCVALLRKYFPRNPEGLCANLHHKATGEWPTEHGKAGIPS